MNSAKQDSGAAGSQTSALVFAGQIVPGDVTVLTESYDGTSWVTAPSVATARKQGTGAGTASAALFFGGILPPGPSNSTEEFTSETTAVNIKDFTTS